jgi:hypothetical protein
MAGRNQRNAADYFSHDADASYDEKIVYLESVFGHTGYALFFKFLERMTRADGFKIEWNDIKKAVYASEFHISVTEIDRFVSECCRKEIQAFVLEEMMLFSPGLMKRMRPLIDKRAYNRAQYEEKKAKENKELPIIKETSCISVTEMTQSKEKKSNNIYSSNFLKFWELYPKKTGKGAAFQAYKKIKEPRPSLQQIELAIKNQNQTEQWQNLQFIPNPATWLNQRRWEDETEITAPSVTPQTEDEILKKYGIS